MSQQIAEAYQIKHSSIVPNPLQPRKFFSQASIEDLANSIQNEGQRMAVAVYRDPSQKAGVFTLVDGERRWRAFKLIRERTGRDPLVKAFVEVIKDPKDLFKKSVIANLHREDLSSVDEAAAIDTLYRNGETYDSIATLIGKSQSYVEGYLKLHTLPDEVKALMDPNLPKDQRLGTTAAIDIARSTKDPFLRIELANEVVDRQLTLMDVRSMITARTGDAGMRYGGHKRRPSEDYRVFAAFLTNTEKKARAMLSGDFEGMYHNRDDELHDRRHDTRLIESTIDSLQRLLKQTKPKVDA